MKPCTKCGLAPSVSYNVWCAVCLGEYNKQYYIKNGEKIRKYQKEFGSKRRKKLQSLINGVKDTPCADCGIKYPPFVMDFDHINGEKEFAVGYGVGNGYSVARLLAEIEKCEVVCANCHRIRTHSRMTSV